MAVREQTTLLSEDVNLSERLSRMQGQEIGPSDVLRVLQRAKLRHVLVGAHAISAWAGDPRATIDVDVVAARPVQARNALAAAFPDLIVEEHPVVIRFKRGRREVIDVIRASSSPVFKEALKNPKRVKLGDIEADVPQLEVALALKFASMVSPTRQDEDRHQDAHDFIRMVKHNAEIHLDELRRLGDLAYSGGGEHILKMLDDVRAGRSLVL